MAARFSGSCKPGRILFQLRLAGSMSALLVFSTLAAAPLASSQILLRASQAGEEVNLMPTDLASLESEEPRKDLPCSVSERKPELGFDLRFHSGYDVSVPLRELAGDGEFLTVLFRVYPEADKSRSAYFVQHFKVPDIDDGAKGDATLQGIIDVGEGKYHIDWLMRDRSERICSSAWDVEAALAPKEKSIPLFIKSNDVSQSVPEPFVNEAFARSLPATGSSLNLKLLVNFAPQLRGSASLKRSDVDALVTILKTIERDPHVGHISLVAFNIDETKVVYRQDNGETIDFPALGKALDSVKLGTVDFGRLSDKHSETGFLEELIEKEVGGTPNTHPDGVIFAGPKAILSADVPQDDLRRIGDIECPVFYLNYNLNPQAVPWKDSISHAIRVFKGTEYTISRPKDLWFSTTEVVSRILRSRRDRSLTGAIAASSGTLRTSQALH
jgi:hypothetical protein